MPMLCFDMDGTIADLYNVPGWLSMLNAEDPTPYRIAKPLYDMKELGFILAALSNQGWEIRVISWLAKDSSPEYKAEVRKAKLEWLKRYKFPTDKVHLVAYGTTKANCVRKDSAQAILVDDNKKVRKGWHLGETIDPTDGDLIERLTALLK